MNDEVPKQIEGNNPNIVEAGKSTRFGAEGGVDPREAIKKRNADDKHPNAIRTHLRRLACAEVDITKPPTAEDMAKMFGNLGTKVTMGQLAAVKKFQQGLTNWKAMDSLIDHIDGKQVQKVVEAKVTLEQLVSGEYAGEGDEPQGTS